MRRIVLSDVDSLPFQEIAHESFFEYPDDETGIPMPGLSAVRYYRYSGLAELRQLHLHLPGIRWNPQMKCAPHFISLESYVDGKWVFVQRSSLPLEPTNGEFHVMDLPNIRTCAVRLICDEEYPMPPCHNEQWANPKIVPFRLLEKVEWTGSMLQGDSEEPAYNPPLEVHTCSLTNLDGITSEDTGDSVKFVSDYFSVSFSKRRPLITEIGWDAFGSRWNTESLIAHTAVGIEDKMLYRYCGPMLRLVDQDILPTCWGGSFEVDGNTVSYHDISPIPSLKLDVRFAVYEDGMDISITQTADEDIPAVEYACWLFPWDCSRSITGTLGLPDRSKGRTGVVPLPAFWSAPGRGSMLVKMLDGDPVCMQVDSWRTHKRTLSGLSMGVGFDKNGFLTIKKGTHAATVSIRKHLILPRISADKCISDIPEGIRRHWATALAFRPELAGFSNNHMSNNCHVNQAAATEIAICTDDIPGAPSMTDLARYTIEFALRDGTGDGDRREYYMDFDPVLVYCASILYNADTENPWTADNWPFIVRAARRILGSIDESGLLCCRSLTGNSGSNGWSSNAWDVVSFGHYDAYSNALAYRALNGLATMAYNISDDAVSKEAHEAAKRIESAYCDCFYNPSTGILAGWRSQDGELHDHCFVFVNALAIVSGLVSGDAARNILTVLESKRVEMGLDFFKYGMACNLEPIPSKDQPVLDDARYRSDGRDRFGYYLNGFLTGMFSEYYVKALSMYGFMDTVESFISDFNKSLITNDITRSEMFTWEGYGCGYEGILTPCYRVLLPMLEHLGFIEKSEL